MTDHTPVASPEALPVNNDSGQHPTEPNAAGKPPGLSIGSKASSLGSALWQETKRNSRVLSLRAQIENLERVDLRSAFAALGRKCHESKICPARLVPRYDEIAALEQQIADNRKGVQAAAGAKAMERLAAMAKDQSGKLSAAALSLKLGGLFADLGEAAAALADAGPLPGPELRHVRNIEGKIAERKASYERLAADHSAGKAIGQEAAGLMVAARTALRGLWHGIARHRRLSIACAAVGALLIGLIIGLAHHRTSGTENQHGGLAGAVDAQSTNPAAMLPASLNDPELAAVANAPPPGATVAPVTAQNQRFPDQVLELLRAAPNDELTARQVAVAPAPVAVTDRLLHSSDRLVRALADLEAALTVEGPAFAEGEQELKVAIFSALGTSPRTHTVKKMVPQLRG